MEPIRSEPAKSLALYFSDLQAVPPLTREEEGLLARSARPETSADLRRLVEGNLRFVVLVAARYRNRGLSYEDLVAEGNIGMLEAAARFDPDRGTRFITYAVWWIRKSILAALREKAPLVPVTDYKM